MKKTLLIFMGLSFLANASEDFSLKDVEDQTSAQCVLKTFELNDAPIKQGHLDRNVPPAHKTEAIRAIKRSKKIYIDSKFPTGAKLGFKATLYYFRSPIGGPKPFPGMHIKITHAFNGQTDIVSFYYTRTLLEDGPAQNLQLAIHEGASDSTAFWVCE